jgi:glutaredoxin
METADMTASTQFLPPEPLQLPANGRAVLVDGRILSRDQPAPAIDALWLKEAADRLAACHSAKPARSTPTICCERLERKMAIDDQRNDARTAVAKCAALLLLVLGLGVVRSGEATDIHRWQDADGKVHFGDRPPTDAKAEQVVVKPNVYSSPSIERRTTPAGDGKSTDDIVLYSTTWCGYCKRAREYFAAEGIAYTEYDVETSEKGRRDYAQLGAHGVPIILVGNQRMNGFSAAAFEQLLTDRGS